MREAINAWEKFLPFSTGEGHPTAKSVKDDEIRVPLAALSDFLFA